MELELSDATRGKFVRARFEALWLFGVGAEATLEGLIVAPRNKFLADVFVLTVNCRKIDAAVCLLDEGDRLGVGKGSPSSALFAKRSGKDTTVVSLSADEKDRRDGTSLFLISLHKQSHSYLILALEYDTMCAHATLVHTAIP